MKMNRVGKTTTIFLGVVIVLLISFTAIASFFFLKESELRKTTEEKLTQTETASAQLKSELEEKNKLVSVLEQKVQEYDDKINDLVEEVDLKSAAKDQMKAENDSLREALKKESADKESLQSEVVATREKIATLESRLQSTESSRSELEVKLKTVEQSQQQSDVYLEKIVVSPGEVPEGKVISTNVENNFVVVNLGQEHGMKQDLVLSVYRKDQPLGEIKVARAQSGVSVADVISPLTSKEIRKDDRVMVKK